MYIQAPFYITETRYGTEHDYVQHEEILFLTNQKLNRELLRVNKSHDVMHFAHI